MIIIARLTVLELVRRRVILVLAGLTLVSVALVGLGVSRLVDLARADGLPELQVQVGVSQVLILIAFMFSFVLAMTAAFLGGPAIAADLESGIALALLARPIRRVDLLLGRWLGLVVIVVAYAVTSGALAVVVVQLVSGHGPPQPLVAIAFLAAQAVVLLTFTLVLGTALPAIAAGAIAVVVFGLSWMAGVVGSIAVFLDAAQLADVAAVSRVLFPSDGLWRGVVYGLEPPALALLNGRNAEVLQANPFYAIDPPPLPFVAWSVFWVVLILAIGSWSLSRREL